MLRKCNFDPEKWLETLYDDEGQAVVDRDTGLEQLTLPTDARVEWFNTYCEENGIWGWIDDSEVRFEANTGSREISSICIATASVYMDDKLVGKSSSSTPFYGHGNYDKSIASITETKAKGRALANAGFMLSKKLKPDNRPGSNAGAPGEDAEAPRVEMTEESNETSPVPSAPPDAAPAETAANAEAANNASAEMTLEQAFAILWPSTVKSVYAGKTLKEVLSTANGKERIALVGADAKGTWFKKYPELVTGCRVIAAAM